MRSSSRLMHHLAQSGAILSDDGRYRYALHRPARRTDRPVLFVMLNPSTADALASDHTLTKCQRFAKRWGLGPVLVGNLFAWRATAPRDLWLSQQHCDIVGPDNERWLDALMEHAERVVVGWGDQPGANEQTTRFLHRYQRRTLTCLGTTKSGAPKHPSRPAYGTRCVPFTPVSCRHARLDGVASLVTARLAAPSSRLASRTPRQETALPRSSAT